MKRRATQNAQQTSLFRRQSTRSTSGAYSGDQPNPNLRAFVEQHLRERPYDPASDRYAAPAFDQPIAATKATAIYNMHTYWSKKPHDAIRQYIRHYTQPGDLVLDPFCGSGGTALAALMEGRKAVAIDRSPAATFITKNYCTPVDPAELQEAFAALQAQVQPEIDWLYATRCDRCGGPATTAYTVYSQVFQCPRCLEKVPLFDCIEVEGERAKAKGESGHAKLINACPHCHTRGVVEEISTRGIKFGAIPVLARYECLGGCKPARDERLHNDPDPRKRDYFQRFDLGKLQEIEAREIPYWVPPHRMMNVEDDVKPWGAEWREGRNFRTVAELFTRRNLWALAAIRAAIGDARSAAQDALLFALNGILLNCSRMYRYRSNLKGGVQNGTYYLPQDSQIINVWRSFADKVQDFARVAETFQIQSKYCISTQSATDLAAIPANSVDYIFTDPPYAEKVQYGELNFVWEAWLGFDTTWHDEEIIVNSVRGKSEADWAAMMRQAMAECYRVLKPGRAISLCYHDTSEGTWALVQDLMAEAGFLVEQTSGALFIDTGQKSYNQLTADKVNKRDLVINFRKPRPGESAALLISGDEDAATFNEKVRAIIREYLNANPWATKDRIYDEVVSRMVRAGRMEPHNFDELLRQVAEPAAQPTPNSLRETNDRWFLKETALAVEDAAESARETAAAKQVRGFIERQLAEDPAAEGVHYSDIFEYFVYTVREKPRRALAIWLLDFFYKTPDGTFRPPASKEEEALKAQARAAGTNRRIRRYVAYLQQGLPVPQAERPGSGTLADWIRQCKRAGLYEDGRLLYERGGLDLDQLSEEQQVAVEEDYQTCMRLIARGPAAAPAGKGRRTSARQESLDL